MPVIRAKHMYTTDTHTINIHTYTRSNAFARALTDHIHILHIIISVISVINTHRWRVKQTFAVVAGALDDYLCVLSAKRQRAKERKIHTRAIIRRTPIMLMVIIIIIIIDGEFALHNTRARNAESCSGGAQAANTLAQRQARDAQPSVSFVCIVHMSCDTRVSVKYLSTRAPAPDT